MTKQNNNKNNSVSQFKTISEDTVSLDSNGNEFPTAENMKFTSKETLHFNKIKKFYVFSPEEVRKEFLSIVRKESNKSLRLFDWFVTKCAAKRTIKIKQSEDLLDRIDVHIHYKSELKTYKKTYFDPFKRKIKFFYTLKIGGEDVTFLTSLGQLNFFRWAFETGIVKYIDDNLDSLLTEMMESNRKDKINSSHKKKMKKLKQDKSSTCVKKDGCNIKAEAYKPVYSNEQKIVISFD
jgi:hypothetical protein